MPMDQTLHLPFIQPSAALLARVREMARAYIPQPLSDAEGYVVSLSAGC